MNKGSILTYPIPEKYREPILISQIPIKKKDMINITVQIDASDIKSAFSQLEDKRTTLKEILEENFSISELEDIIKEQTQIIKEY